MSREPTAAPRTADVSFQREVIAGVSSPGGPLCAFRRRSRSPLVVPEVGQERLPSVVLFAAAKGR